MSRAMSFTQDNPLISVVEKERKGRSKSFYGIIPPVSLDAAAARRLSDKKKRMSHGSMASIYSTSSYSSDSSTSSSFSNQLISFRNSYQKDELEPQQQQQQHNQQQQQQHNQQQQQRKRITDRKNALTKLTQTELNFLYSSDYKFAGEELIAYQPEKLSTILKEAAYLFNKKPINARDFLVSKKVNTGLPEEFAEYIYSQSVNQSRLSKRRMGEFLGDISIYNQEVLDLFLLKINFCDMTLDQAIRSLVRYFRLPGEAQQIDRILEKFASVYVKQNNDSGEDGTHNSAIKSASVAYVLSFSILMLNTDLHNPSVARKEKMTLDEFIRNNRGINDGKCK
jgi:Sec7-like guanine-nucleotide exchange factor